MKYENLIPGENPPESLYVFVEAKKGSRVIYRYNRKYDNIILYKIVRKEFPFCYGRVPKTHHIDTGTLDAFILSVDNLEIGSLAKVRLIGCMRSKRDNVIDDKLLCVLEEDKNYENVKNLKDIPSYILRQIEDFLKENGVIILEWLDVDKTKKIIINAIEIYNQMR